FPRKNVCLPPCSHMTTRNTVPGCGDGSRRSGARSKADGEESMEYLIGVGLAVVVCAFATLVGFDCDRVFYPMLVTVIVTYYILFAVIGSSRPALALESLVAGAFLALAVAGFKKNLWL